MGYASGLIQGTIGATPLDRLDTPEGIAEAVLWLCSDAASFVPSHALTVAGGYAVP